MLIRFVVRYQIKACGGEKGVVVAVWDSRFKSGITGLSLCTIFYSGVNCFIYVRNWNKKISNKGEIKNVPP